ncbi:hypothetical protein ISN44_As08g034720, partial [Arabidopsis suecica]
IPQPNASLIFLIEFALEASKKAGSLNVFDEMTNFAAEVSTKAYQIRKYEKAKKIKMKI